jgi:hypothetical protein
MTISDLDRIHHPATIEGGKIRVRHLELDAEQFTLSGLVLVDYDAQEEAELMKLGFLSRIYRGKRQ